MNNNEATAYTAARTTSQTLRGTLNVIIVLVTLLLNFVLVMSGLQHALGLYATLIYLVLLFVVDVALEQLSRRRTAMGCYTTSVRLEPSSHQHACLPSNPIALYIGIWLLRWVAADLFFEASLVFSRNWPVLVFLLPLALLSSFGSSQEDSRGAGLASTTSSVGIVPALASTILAFAPDAFCVVFLIALGFPTAQWLPQTEPVVLTIVRDFVYFVTVLLADYFMPCSMLDEQQARLTDEQVRANATDDAAAASAGLMSATFCAIVLDYDAVTNANRRRSRRVIAVSAWILVCAPAVFVAFSIIMLLTQALLVLLRFRDHKRGFAALETGSFQSTPPPPESPASTSSYVQQHEPQQTLASVAIAQTKQDIPIPPVPEAPDRAEIERASNAQFSPQQPPVQAHTPGSAPARVPGPPPTRRGYRRVQR